MEPQPPFANYPQTPPPGIPQVAPYRPFAGLQTLLIVMTIAAIVANVVGIFLPDSADYEDASVEAVAVQLVIMALLGLALAAVSIAQVVVGVVWMHRAYSNVKSFGARGLAWSPGWAVGAWFIPIANLVIPFMIMVEIWKSSHPDAPGPDGWKSLPTPGWLVALWVLWVGAFVASAAAAIGIAFALAVADLSYLGGVLIQLPGAALYATAGILFLRYVALIQQHQDQRARVVAPPVAPADWIST